MNRAAIYTRQSVARDDSVSMELQETACREYCARRGYTVVEVITDRGVSGLKWEKRPGVQDLMGKVRDGRVDVVVVWRWSRLSRNRLHQAVALDIVERAGARVESATEPFDTSTAGGEFGRDVMLAAAHFESRQKSEQWKEAHARRRRLGLPAQGGDRFGYTRDGAIYMPDPETGPVLAGMYADYIAGAGFTAIAFRLNREGRRTLWGNAWSRDRVTHVLDSGFGAGMIRRGRRSGSTYERGAHEPVVDGATWQAYLSARRLREGTPARVVEPRYVLTGLIVCGEPGCGAPMHPTALGRHTGYGYQCSRWAQSRQCRCVTVSRAKAEAAVRVFLEEIAADVDKRAAVKRARVETGRNAKAEAAAARRDLARVEAALEKLTSRWALDEVPPETYVQVRDDLLRGKALAGKRLDEAVALQAELRVSALPIARQLLAEWGTLAVADRRRMLQHLVRRVRVVRGERRGAVSVVVDPL